MATSPAPRWQRLDHDERRRQILECAGRLFSERPYAEVSTSDIARQAGVARGLLNHYFGTKRELYLEVVRTLLRVPPTPVPFHGAGPDAVAIIDDGVDRWLTVIERNRGTWLAAIGGRGLGRDPEVEAILDDAREAAVDRLLAVLGPAPSEPPRELRALVRAYAAFAEAASLEWLQRGRLTREQTRTALVRGFFGIVGDVCDAVRATEDPLPAGAS